MDVSIIIVSFNTRELTVNCIQSIYEKTAGINFEIIVVDNASEDGSPDSIRKFKDLTLIESKVNLGFGRANNLGVKKAAGKYVFLLNSDTILVNNAVKILFDFMEKPENRKIGCSGGALYNEDMTYQASYSNFRGWDEILGFSKIISKIYSPKDPIRRAIESGSPIIRKVDYVSGADMFIRRSLYDQLQGFDENLFLYFEESDLCIRLRKMGFKTVLNTEARIIHFGGKSTSIPNIKKIAIFERSKYYYYRKYYGFIGYAAAKAVQIVMYSMIVLLRLFTLKFDQFHWELLKITWKI